MKTAVIKSGGKQYVVTDGSHVRLEKLELAEGAKVSFNEVLLTSSGAATSIGTPFIQGAVVEGTVITHGRRPKVTGVKMKAKKRHKKYFGHKQHYTLVEITKIATG